MPSTRIERAIFQGRLKRRLRHSSGSANGPSTTKSNSKGLEQLTLIHRHADARVNHIEYQLGFAIGAGVQPHGGSHASGVGELDGVTDQIDQDLRSVTSSTTSINPSGTPSESRTGKAWTLAA